MLQHAGNAPNPTWQPAVSHLQNGIKPSIGVENKSAINLHCPGERLSFHIPRALEHFWSVTPHHRCRQTQKLRLLHKNKGRTHPCRGMHVLPPSGQGWIRLMRLLHNQGQLQRQSLAFNLEAPCTHTWCLPRDHTSQSPKAHALRWSERPVSSH